MKNSWKYLLILACIFCLSSSSFGWVDLGWNGRVPNVHINTSDPTTSDSDEQEGDIWFNTTDQKVFFCFGGGSYSQNSSTLNGGVSNAVTVPSGTTFVALGGIVVNSADADDASGASLFVKGDGNTSGTTPLAVERANGTNDFTLAGDGTASLASGTTFYLDRTNGYGIWTGSDGKAYIKDASSSRQM